MRDSNSNKFGRWITTQSWQDVKNAAGTKEKTDVFYSTFLKAWITPRIKCLIHLRQKA